MRVSVTITDEINKILVDLAKKKEVSKDKLIGSILVDHLDEPVSYSNDYVDTLKSEKAALDDKYYALLIEHKKLKASFERLQESKHNERGAGRKQEFGEAHKLAMKKYKADGLSYRQIAEKYQCSVGTVHKLINEQ